MRRRLGVAFALSVLAWRGFAAQVPGELRGRVTDARTARPIENGVIDVAGGPSVRSIGGGEYVVRGLEPGTHAVRVRAFGFARRSIEVSIANGRATQLDVALEPSAAALDPVTIVGSGSTDRTALTFDRAAIVQSNKRDVGELLQGVPGLVVTQSGGPGAASHVSIRGSASNEVLVMLDGVPLNSSLDGDVDLSRLSLETAERVVVHTGAQSARFGPGALAGVIEIQTRRPTGDVSALGRMGAWGERGSALTLGERHSFNDALHGALSITGDYRTARGDFTYEVPTLRGGGTDIRRNADVTARQLLGTGSLEGESWDARLRGGWSDLTRGMAGSIVQPSMTGRQSQQRISGGVDSRGRRGVLSWTALADVSRERATYADSAPPFGNRFDDTVRATGISGGASATIGGDALSGTLGVDAQTLDVASSMLEATAPHWQRTTGVWSRLRGEHGVNDGLMLDAELAGRIDHTSLVEGTNFSPRVSLGATTTLVTVSGSIGAGYAPPSLSDQFFHEGVQVQANPSLRPERTRHDVEARIALHEQSFGGLRLAGDAAVYRADVDGMILWMPDFRYVWSPSNFDVARSGWELGARAALPVVRLDGQASFARSDVTYQGSVLSGQVAYRPRTTSNLTLGFSPGPIRLETTTRYVGERRTVPGSALNTLDPYWRTDVKLSYGRRLLAWHVDASVAVDNVLDQAAAMLVDYPFPSRSWSVSVRLQRNDRAAMR
jgi:outer membrane cobalamin receptor